MFYSQLSEWNISNKRIFLRADLNVPLNNKIITNDFRLKSIMPTLNFILEHNGMVILATHISNPTQYDANFSTELLIPWFKKHGYSIQFSATPADAMQLKTTPKTIVLLENLRFFKGEKTGDPFFAKQLAQTACFFVNDAFGALHKNDTSISLLPYEFLECRRTVGFLIEKELTMLNGLKTKPKAPFIAILGGSKIEKKIPLIQGLLKKTDTVLVCPALCFSFLKSLQIPVGKSLVNENLVPLCKKIIFHAQNNHKKIIFPQDYLTAQDKINGTLSYKSSSNFSENDIGISIGPRTTEQFIQIINQAETIFFNCAMGFTTRPETTQSTQALLHAICLSKKQTIIAGGDTVERAFEAGIKESSSFIHLSTGGGAALAYLSDQKLPGLIPFAENNIALNE